MNNQVVSFKTAKLAKEKGFDVPTHDFYRNDGKYGWHEPIPEDFDSTHRVSAPTQSLLHKWLREKYSIVIIIDYDYYTYSCKILTDPYSPIHIVDCGKLSDNSWLKTYEDVLEKGLQEALKLVNNE